MAHICREYFYTVDLRGRLWHAGSELTDPAFLRFFFCNLRPNTTGRHPEYPYVSPCGAELNYVRAADTPIVFQKLSDGRLWYAGGLSVPFVPEALSVSADGVLYHPAPVGTWGRLAPALALELGAAMEPWGPYFLLRLPERPCGVIVLPRELTETVQKLTLHTGAVHAPDTCIHWLFTPSELRAETWLHGSPMFQEPTAWLVWLCCQLIRALGIPGSIQSPALPHVELPQAETLQLTVLLDCPPPETTQCTFTLTLPNGQPLATGMCPLARPRGSDGA